MPATKDFKRLVRARMRKTGEAYTAARAQIINKAPRPASPRLTAEFSAPPAPPEPSPADYAAIAGMADDKVKAATGCTWERWVYALDRKKAYELSHRELALLIHEKYKTPSWWTQTVAVGYERIKGLRVKGQQRNGTFQATKSRTFNVAVSELYDAWADAKTRRKWLDGGEVRVRTSSPPKSIRLEIDGAIIAVGFTAKGGGKSSVAVEQDKLPSREAAAEVKRFWTERFDALGEVLDT
jgi:hypothetical protein